MAHPKPSISHCVLMIHGPAVKWANAETKAQTTWLKKGDDLFYEEGPKGENWIQSIWRSRKTTFNVLTEGEGKEETALSEGG